MIQPYLITAGGRAKPLALSLLGLLVALGSLLGLGACTSEVTARCKKGDRMEVRIDGHLLTSKGQTEPSTGMDLDHLFGVGAQGEWSVDLKGGAYHARAGNDEPLLSNARYSNMSATEARAFFKSPVRGNLKRITRLELQIPGPGGRGSLRLAAGQLQEGHYEVWFARDAGCNYMNLRAMGRFKDSGGAVHTLEIQGRQAQ